MNIKDVFRIRDEGARDISAGDERAAGPVAQLGGGSGNKPFPAPVEKKTTDYTFGN